MSAFAIIATFEVVPGRRDELLPLLLAHRDRCLRDEPGTLRFDVLQPRQEDNKVLAYEVYRDEAAFQTHWNGPHVARIRQEMAGLVEKLSGVRCTLHE